MSTKLPACLKRPLRFGDKEQIEALKTLEEQSEKPELKEYRVRVWYSGSTVVQVWANSASQAEKMAHKMDIEPDDVTIDETEAEEVKR